MKFCPEHLTVEPGKKNLFLSLIPNIRQLACWQFTMPCNQKQIIPNVNAEHSRYGTSIAFSLLSAAATRVSMFKAEPNPVIIDY